ncbi:unnamed protein product [Urochloa humidicola]
MAPGEIANKAPVASGGNGIDALPDGVLEHILGFLPASEAVRTCVLACRWRHLWKFATGLRINSVPERTKTSPSYVKLLQFVDHLLEHRGRAPLKMCELTVSMYDYPDDVLLLNSWIQQVAMCKVQMLKFTNIVHGCIQLDPVVSQYLVRLELSGLILTNRFCNLQNCPSLKHLQFEDCDFFAQKIQSKSLKCLSLQNSLPDKIRFNILICAPSLVSFRLDDHWCRTPVFESVPLLQEAFVRVTGVSPDCCCDEPSHEDGDVEDCLSCYSIEHYNKRLLLEGLSEVVNLSMIAESRMVILE